MSFFPDTETALFDTLTDPEQRRPLVYPSVEARLTVQMRSLMEANDAPPEAYTRLGLESSRSRAA